MATKGATLTAKHRRRISAGLLAQYKPSAEGDTYIAQEYREGRTIRDIANELDCAVGAVHNALRRTNTRRRSVGPVPKKKKKARKRDAC